MKTKLAFAAVTCCLLLGCNRDDTSATAAPEVLIAAEPAPAPLTQTPSASDGQAVSIYDLRVSLLDDTGAARSLDTFRGHPVLITMFYGTCPVACPLLTSDLKRIERQIPAQLRSDVRIVMVSFDADRDTPTALAKIKQERGLEGAHWTLTSTTDEEARELAGVLNIKFRKLDDGAFFHSSVIVLLDRQGRPQARIEGAGKDASAILTALAASSI